MLRWRSHAYGRACHCKTLRHFYRPHAPTLSCVGDFIHTGSQTSLHSLRVLQLLMQNAMGAALALLLLLAPAAALEVVLVAEGNPHDATADTGCCPAQALPPETLLPEAPFLTKQQDTFVRARPLRHAGRSVPVFTFRQPERLSHRMLPFDLALVTDVDPTGIVEVAAPAESASDSWFPDYAWSHFVVCSMGDAPLHTAKHLGWRFTRKPHAVGLGPASFVALIVRPERRDAEPTGAELASPIAVSAAGATKEGDDDESVEAVYEAPLSIGVEAPGWLLKMMAALTARSARSASS